MLIGLGLYERGERAISVPRLQRLARLGVPRIIGQAVNVPAVVTMVAALLGAALQGIVGSLVAIPAAAALLLLTQEVLIARLDHT